MRLPLILIFTICACIPLAGQAQINLVRNPSFEQYTTCPTMWQQGSYATWWNGIDTTFYSGDTLPITCPPDYINECSTTIYTSAPSNGDFYHYPRTGNGMMEIEMYSSIDDSSHGTDTSYGGLRIYLQGKLKSTLVAGQTYCVTYYATLEQISGWAVNNFGAYFDNGNIDTVMWQNCGNPQTEYTPQINDTSIISDTLNWIKVQGSFTANGTERFITIGNFFDSAHTAIIPVPVTPFYALPSPGNYIAYYLIDDVSVIPIDATANAGSAGATSAIGDSVFIGTSDGYLPCKWYIVGAGLIDSNIAGFNVHPDTTTKYVMALDVCGTISYDTVTITVWPLGLATPLTLCNIQVYPNPVAGELNISGLMQNATYRLLDITGNCLQTSTLQSGNNTVPVRDIIPGTYLLEITGTYGEKKVMRVMKE